MEPPVVMTTPVPDGSSASEEYLRRAAEAAESTRRNLRIIVWVFVGAPLIIGALVLVGLIVGGIGSSISAQSEESSYERVMQVYQEVSYTPPSYTTVRNQVAGICQNLSEGMSQSSAALTMWQSFGDLSQNQANKIVEAAAENVCSG